MNELGAHASLVTNLLIEMKKRFAPLDDLCILVDDLRVPVQQRPPAIGGKVPDVHLRSVGSQRVVAIGEAKTAQDVDNGHTRSQLGEYFAYLKHHPSAFLVLAVPWHHARLIASIAAKLQIERAATNVSVIVLENLPG